MADALAVVALVEENALGVAAVEGDFAEHSVLLGEEGFGKWWAAEVLGGIFLLLTELFVVDGAGLGAQPGEEGGGRCGLGGGEEPVVGKGFEVDARHAVACAIDEAKGIGFCGVEGGAALDGVNPG